MSQATPRLLAAATEAFRKQPSVYNSVEEAILVETERINVTLPHDLVDEIDRVAGARRRSAFLAEAAREKLARLRFDQVATQAFGAWKDEDHPELATDAGVRRFLTRGRAATNRRMRKRLNDA